MTILNFFIFKNMYEDLIIKWKFRVIIKYYRSVSPNVDSITSFYNVIKYFHTLTSVCSGQVKYGGIRRSSVSPRPTCHGILRLTYGLRPGRRQARHAHILQIKLYLTQPQSTRLAPRHVPIYWTPTRQNPMGGILCGMSRHMPV